VTSAEEFIEFATAASSQLQRTAFLLCGDWHTAEDLVQATLAKVFVSWRRIRRRDAAHAYATRTLVNTYLAVATELGLAATRCAGSPAPPALRGSYTASCAPAATRADTPSSATTWLRSAAPPGRPRPGRAEDPGRDPVDHDQASQPPGNRPSSTRSSRPARNWPPSPPASAASPP
jgi:hypothetical protein